MKKILLFASALAGLFLAGSCQRENLEPEQTGKQVTFTVEAPAAMQTKAIADGKNVDQLIYEVWITGQSQKVTDLSGATRLYQATTDNKTVADGKVSFKITLDLVNDQNFTVLFWAQNSANGVYKTDELTKVTYLENANVLANYANRDAFYGSAFVSDGATETPTVTLKRPFAQVNLCTLNLKDTQKEGDYTITLDESKMTFTTVPNMFNIATGDASGEMLLEFDYNAVPGTGVNADPKDKTIMVNGKPYYYAGMNFVFADKNEGNTAKLEYDIQTKLNETVEANVNNTIDQIPLKQNYRTNIVGNLLTSKVDYEIIVDAEFAGDWKDYEIWDGKTKNAPSVVDNKYVINKASEFAWLEAPQRLEYDVVLASNIDMGKNTFKGILSNGKSFDGAGHTLMNVKLNYTSEGQAWSSLFVTGGGQGANSKINVKNLTIDGAYVVAAKSGNGNAAVIACYAEKEVVIENVKVRNSVVEGTQSIGALVGHVAADLTTIKNCEVEAVTLTTYDVAGESGNIGGVVGRVTGKCNIENTSISNSVINAYVNDGSMTDQKRTVSKYVGNFYGSGAQLTVTGGSIDNVTINHKNDLALTQSCL